MQKNTYMGRKSGLTPNKSQRRHGAKDPSPPKPFKLPSESQKGK